MKSMNSHPKFRRHRTWGTVKPRLKLPGESNWLVSENGRFIVGIIVGGSIVAGVIAIWDLFR